MPEPLIARFSSHWPSRFSPEGEALHGYGRRQEQLIDLAQSQIEVQEVAAKELAASSSHGASIIANSLEEQTEILGSMIGYLGERLSNDLSRAATGIKVEIRELGGRVCGSLDEIRWQLAQQSKTLDGILETLLHSRTNEAQQLVRQGVRHFDNEELDEAEERFLLAQEKDSTDFQVLLNLAFLEVHKGDANGAEWS